MKKEVKKHVYITASRYNRVRIRHEIDKLSNYFSNLLQYIAKYFFVFLLQLD